MINIQSRQVYGREFIAEKEVERRNEWLLTFGAHEYGKATMEWVEAKAGGAAGANSGGAS